VADLFGKGLCFLHAKYSILLLTNDYGSCGEQKAIREQIDAFKDGFHELMPPELIR
jgi:hypothetical protein